MNLIEVQIYFFFTVNMRTYCARRYVIQVRESHVSPMNLEMARALEDKRHRWSKEMKTYDRGFKRIEKKLDKVHEQNQQLQKKIKKINEKPRDHADEIKLLLYLEEKKRPDEFVKLEYCPRVLRLAYDGYVVV